MIRFHLIYCIRNNILPMILLRMILFAPFIFLHSAGYFLWGLFFLYFLWNFFKNPFTCFPEAKNLFLSTGCNISEYIKCANLTLLLLINLSYSIVAICISFFYKLAFFDFVFLFFLINTGVFFLCTLGNVLYFSDLHTIKSKFVQNFIYVISYQLLLTALTMLFFFIKIIPNVTVSLTIMLILMVISFVVWIITKNKYKKFKYYFPIQS